VVIICVRQHLQTAAAPGVVLDFHVAAAAAAAAAAPEDVEAVQGQVAELQFSQKKKENLLKLAFGFGSFLLNYSNYLGV
jgi:hypothetical protein